mmetsp:Transcript_2154/g.2244  ORF Transcript_2154/g.2244 Transcript_2154/m.2244 type:complete len:180 (+) Transcript_2154:81-620(+)
MTEFLNEKYISIGQVKVLETQADKEELRKLFVEIFSLQNFVEEKRIIITDYYIKNYRFCQQQAFNFEKTATFLSIIHDILQRDINLTTSETSAIKSYQRFEEILLRHSVDRPPKSIKIFDRRDIEPIIDFVSERYFRNFMVFSSLFGKISRVSIHQVLRNHIEQPPTIFPSLNTAVISR